MNREVGTGAAESAAEKAETAEAADKKRCPKCRSLNIQASTHCRYCHAGFGQVKTFVERKEKVRLNRRLLVAGGSVLAFAAGYIFRRRAAERKDQKSDKD